MKLSDRRFDVFPLLVDENFNLIGRDDLDLPIQPFAIHPARRIRYRTGTGAIDNLERALLTGRVL